MNYLIKYGFMVILLVALAMNIIEPSMEHRILQSISALGVLLIFYIDWWMKRIYKKILDEIKHVPVDDEV